MKEFEKWWEKKHPEYDMRNNTIAEYEAAKKGWKAALEHVLKERCDTVEFGMQCPIERYIEEELEGCD